MSRHRRSDAKSILAVEDPGDDGDLPVAKTTSPLRYFRRDNPLDGRTPMFGLPFSASRRCHARVHKVVSRTLTVVVVFDGTRDFPKRIAYIINLVAYYDSAVTTGLRCGEELGRRNHDRISKLGRSLN
ncbi:hypothetical protein DFH09DRAFT_1087066 [Mycena vulgaris]|nr:hypothetical protein DFH09DRAFT_1087066 [Mycena vulgaris]